MKSADLSALERRISGRTDRRDVARGRESATADRREDFPVFGARQLRQMESSACPMRIFDHASLRYLAANDAALALYGYSRAEFLRLSVLDTRHPHDLRTLQSSIAEPTGDIQHFNSRRQVRKSGEVFVADIVTQDVRFEGRAARLSITIDVSERVGMQELLRQREESFAALVNHSPDIISRLDRDLRHLYVSPAIEAATGRPPEAFVGRTVAEVGLPAEIVALWRTAVGRVFASGCEDTLECTGQGPRGPRHYECRLVPEFGSAGEVRTVLVITRDITERKAMEDALRESEERFRQLAENIDEVFWIVDPETGNFLYVSPAYSRIWGRDPESARRDAGGWMALVHREDIAVVHAAQKQMACGQHTDVEYRIVRDDGTTRWIRDRSYPTWRVDGTPLICGIAEDVTRLKQAERVRLAHAIHQRDALVREVHHRIKNHLQGIAGLLRGKAGDNPAARGTIEAAVAQLQSVAVVYGLQSELAGSGVPLARVLEAICTTAEGLGAVRIARDLPVGRGGGICLAEAEAAPVAVALNELVFNAIEHGARGQETPVIAVALAERGHRATIRIANRGRLPARFDYRRGIGAGTGLELVRTLLGPAGCALEFDSRGGEVAVTLRLDPPLVARVPAAAPVVGPVPR